MALHVNIEKLIKGEVVETGRIEYKSGWNPENVIHSMCAFANDINNLGGGYIVIGVEEKDGIPQLPPVGLQKNQLDAIHKQLLDALEYINTNVIHEEVVKVQGRAEANRFYNYPYAAIEEVLANAVYHKSYELRNPIEVNVRPNQIEVLSFPGPLPPVDNKMLKKKRIVSREYRNRRIGDFLKELQLTEGRATGFPKIYDAMHKNGSRKPHFETDEDRTYFLARLPVHPEMKWRGQAGGEVKGEVRGEATEKSLNDTERAILKLLEKGPSSAEELANELGLKSRSGFFTRTLRGLMKDGFIEYLYPESPRHPEQKYVLKRN